MIINFVLSVLKLALLLFTTLYAISCSKSGKQDEEPEELSSRLGENTIINLYDAFGEQRQGLTKDFGFSCIVKYEGKTILFDSGTNAETFKNNLKAMNIDLTQIDFAVASHSHFDHINGFDYLLKINPKVKIYFPMDLFWGANTTFDLSGKEANVSDSLETRMQYFDGDFKNMRFNQSGRFWNANIEFVQESMEIAPGITLVTTSSPYMGYFNMYPSKRNPQNSDEGNVKLTGLNEISLSLKSNNGEVLFVGCSHSTVEKIIEETQGITGNSIELVYGGYHLLPYDRKTLNDLALRLKNDLKVKKVAPTHCTGHLGFKILKDHYGEDYVFAGLGETVSFD